MSISLYRIEDNTSPRMVASRNKVSLKVISEPNYEEKERGLSLQPSIDHYYGIAHFTECKMALLPNQECRIRPFQAEKNSLTLIVAQLCPKLLASMENATLHCTHRNAQRIGNLVVMVPFNKHSKRNTELFVQ